MPSERDCVEHLINVSKAIRTRKLQLQETVALGLLVSIKWDRAKSRTPVGNTPTNSELSLADNFTDGELSNLRETALALLDQHVDRTMSWRQWWSGVMQGLVAIFLWSMLLFIAGALAIYFHGGDIGSTIKSFVVDTPASQR